METRAASVSLSDNHNAVTQPSWCANHKKEIVITAIALIAISALVIGTLLIKLESAFAIKTCFISTGSSLILLLASTAITCMLERKLKKSSSPLKTPSPANLTNNSNLPKSDPIPVGVQINAASEKAAPITQETIESHVTSNVPLEKNVIPLSIQPELPHIASTNENLNIQKFGEESLDEVPNNAASEEVASIVQDPILVEVEPRVLVEEAPSSVSASSETLQLVSTPENLNILKLDPKSDEAQIERASEDEKIVPIGQIQEFAGYALQLIFPDKTFKSIEMQDGLKLQTLFEEIQAYLSKHLTSLMICYVGYKDERKEDVVSDDAVEAGMKYLELSSYAKDLSFQISKYTPRSIVIHYKPNQEREITFKGFYTEIHRNYLDGTREKFKLELKEGRYLQGERLFVDFSREEGLFDIESRALVSGCRYLEMGNFLPGFRYPIERETIELVNPKPLVFYNSVEQGTTQKMGICRVCLEFVVFDETNKLTEVFLIDALLKAAQYKSERWTGQSIAPILSSPYFSISERKLFIQQALKSDRVGIPCLFDFSNEALLDVVEVGAELGLIDPLKIVEPTTNYNLFDHAYRSQNKKLYSKLIELFSADYEKIKEGSSK